MPYTWSKTGNVSLGYGKTKLSVKRNIRTEMAHGKPHKQAVAIALSVQRRGRPRQKSLKQMFGK